MTDIAGTGRQALDGMAGAEPALLEMAGPPAVAHFETVGGTAVAAQYLERRLFLAEAVGDLEALAPSVPAS